jgi:hypothetical protein
MSEFTIGYEGKLYYLSTGTRTYWGSSEQGDFEASGAAPANLVEAVNVQDLDLKIEMNEWDATTRESLGVDQAEPTTMKAEITFTMVYDTSDAFFAALKTACLNRTAIPVACLDAADDEAGAEGLWADMKVFGFSRSEKLKEGMNVPITLKPCRSSVHPQWVTVAASS